MSNCRDLEPLLAPYVDGEAEPQASTAIDAHLDRCPPCREDVAVQRAAREVLAARRDSLRGSAAGSLRERCAAQRALARPPLARPAPRPNVFRRAFAPMALAASLLVVAGVSGVLWLNPGVELFAAQIAADHVKCHLLADADVHADPVLLSNAWKRDRGWSLVIPAGAAAYGLQLVGMRRCGSTEGANAHILYKWRGQPLSLYVMNGVAQHAGADAQLVTKLGQETVIWSDHGRTYAVVADADPRELEPIVKYVKLNMKKW